MGYYTWYNFEIEPEPADDHPIWKETVDSDINVATFVSEGQDLKWYDHDAEMVLLSKKYPEFLFTIDGAGEETGDIWRTYYKNGLHFSAYQPEWVPPTFEEIKYQMVPWNLPAAKMFFGEAIFCQRCLVKLELYTSGNQTLVNGEVDDTFKDELVCPKCGFTTERPEWYLKQQ